MHKETKIKSTLPHWWTYVASRMRIWTQNSEEGRVVLLSVIVKDDSKCVCSCYWTKLFCVPNDCRKSNECYCRITRLRQTSSWCNICLHSIKIWGRCQIAQNSRVRSWAINENPVVLHERNLYGHPIAGLLCERQFKQTLSELGWEKVPSWECMFVCRKQRLFLSEHVDDIKMAGQKQDMAPMWKTWMKNVDLMEPTSFLDYVYLGCTQRECKTKRENYWTIQQDVWITFFRVEQLKLTRVGKTSHKDWCLVLRHGRTSSNMRWAILLTGMYNVSGLCLDDHHFKEEELESVGSFSQVCSQSVLTWVLCFSEVEHLSPSVGCARDRFQFHTVLLKLKSLFSMQVYAWTVFPLTLWDLVIEVFHSVLDRTEGPKRESDGETRRQLSSQTSITRSQSSTPTSFQQTLNVLVDLIFFSLWTNLLVR